MVHMPTGDEPPKGFEKLYAERQALPQQGALTIDYVSVSQLASMEKKELERLRIRAGKLYQERTGNDPNTATIEETLYFTPKGKTTSDKMIFRAYSGKFLAGYAQVLCGWPESDEWTVMSLTVDPSFRGIGIGRQVVVAIEEAAKAAAVTANHIYAIPTMVVNENYWDNLGFDTRTDSFQWEIGDEKYDLYMVHKAL